MTSGNVSDEPIAYGDEDARGAPARHRRPASSCTTARSRRAPTTRWCARWAALRREPLMLRRSRGYVPASIALPRAGAAAAGLRRRAEEHLLPGAGRPRVGVAPHRRPQELGDAAAPSGRAWSTSSGCSRWQPRGGGPRPPPRVPVHQVRAGARGGGDRRRCSTTTPTWPPAWPSTARRARRWGRSTTAPATARTAPCGAASCWWATWPAFERAGSAARGAHARRRPRRARSRGGWRARGCWRLGRTPPPALVEAAGDGALGAGERGGARRRGLAAHLEHGPAVRRRGRAVRPARGGHLRGAGGGGAGGGAPRPRVPVDGGYPLPLDGDGWMGGRCGSDRGLGRCPRSWPRASTRAWLRDGRGVRALAATPAGRVVLSGVFQNRLLLELTVADLRQRGLRVLLPERLPPNDGGSPTAGRRGGRAAGRCSRRGDGLSVRHNLAGPQ